MFYTTNKSRSIDVLEIQETSIELKPGDIIQLTVKGYKYQNGKDSMKEVDLSGLQIDWHTNGDDTDFKVDENGKLEALKEGIGNVQVCYKDKVFSSPITVFVRNHLIIDEAVEDFLKELNDNQISEWMQQNLNSDFDSLFSDYNGEVVQRIVFKDEFNYSPSICPDIIFYKASSKEQLNDAVKKMVDEMITPLTEENESRAYTITAYSIEDQQLIPVKENVWILPMLNVYYQYTGVDMVTMETYMNSEPFLLKGDMMPLMRQGSDSSFVYLLIEKDGVYRLQRALDMCH